MTNRSFFRRFPLVMEGLRHGGPRVALEELLNDGNVREFPTRVTSPPKVAQIEVTNRCNLRCQMCPLADPDYEPTGGEAHLSLEQFSKILEKLPSLEAVSLQGLGEPLLNPDLPAIVRLASGRGIHVTFFSNGMLLTEERAIALLESGLGHLVFSLDGGTAETYERIRRGAKLSRVLENIRRIVELKIQRGLQRPDLSLMAVGMKENLNELPQIVRIAGDLGIPVVTIKNLYQDAGLPGTTASLERQDIEGLRKEIEQVARECHVEVSLPQAAPTDAEPQRTCRWPWTAVYVKVHGQVSPCCYGIHHEFCNLFESGSDQIWNNPEIKQFRTALRRGQPEICKTCPDYSIVMEKLPIDA